MSKRSIPALGLAVLLLSAPASWGTTLSAYPLWETVLLFEQPGRDAEFLEVKAKEEEISLSERAYAQGAFWYRIAHEGRDAWIFQDDLYILAGGESALVSTALETADGAFENLFDGMGPDGSWIRRGNALYEGDENNGPGVVMTWASKDAVIQTMSTEHAVLPLYFALRTAEASDAFLGFPAVGMTEDEIANRFGAATAYLGGALVYDPEDGGGHRDLRFTLSDGAVTLVESSVFPGNGVELPERIYELRRFRSEANEYPRAALCAEHDVPLRPEPSRASTILTTIQRDASLWVVTAVDRGEPHLWYEVETADRRRGYVYGEHVALDDSPRDPVRRCTDFLRRGGAAGIAARLGEPEAPPKEENGRTVHQWPGLTVWADGQTGGADDIVRFMLRQPVCDFCGVRPGDGVYVLDELLELMTAHGWSGGPLHVGENRWTSGERDMALSFDVEDQVQGEVLSSITFDRLAPPANPAEEEGDTP
ncbi:MAG TPA: hypothetical protein DIC53_04450 [Synergistaceae bacterium]|jgi:hypothetical protein|nr:hypothetical protein [Synergistaceae bacterium]